MLDVIPRSANYKLSSYVRQKKMTAPCTIDISVPCGPNRKASIFRSQGDLYTVSRDTRIDDAVI